MLGHIFFLIFSVWPSIPDMALRSLWDFPSDGDDRSILHRVPRLPWNFLGEKNIFCSNEMTLGELLVSFWMGPDHQKDQSHDWKRNFQPHPSSTGEGRGAGDWMNNWCCLHDEVSQKSLNEGVLFSLGECIHLLGRWHNPIPQGQNFLHLGAFWTLHRVLSYLAVHLYPLLYPLHTSRCVSLCSVSCYRKLSNLRTRSREPQFIAKSDRSMTLGAHYLWLASAVRRYSCGTETQPEGVH